MIAFIGWLCGYDGSFKFDEIEYSYETHPAPYIAYRSFQRDIGHIDCTNYVQHFEGTEFQGYYMCVCISLGCNRYCACYRN
ncbi:ANM_collapsed_G0031250.mRNA.1.CDS.1 [Saccharomyces cerevisiae]|nr:ANM_collapsed_G0031250.mRNA.1.CDS.1 [Saccharomyces cerevisiae]